MNAVVKELVKTEVVLAQLAWESHEDANGDRDAAARALLDKLRSRRALYASIAKKVMFNYAYSLILDAVHSQRSKLWQPSPKKFENMEYVAGSKGHADYQRQDVIELGKATFEHWWLRATGTSVRITDANKEQVLAEAESYARAAKTATSRYKWLMLIAEKMGDAARVSDALDDAELLKLQFVAEGA